MRPLKLLDAFITPLERGGIDYFATGSVAAIFYGDPRLTHDVDIVVHLPVQRIADFMSLFPESEYYCPPEEVIHIELNRRGFAHFNLIHHETGLKADIYPDLDDELHSWAFKHKRRVELEAERGLWLAPPEYVIIRKLEYYREGGSSKHLDDIRKMLVQIERDLDRDFLNAELEKRGLRSLWTKLQGPLSH